MPHSGTLLKADNPLNILSFPASQMVLNGVIV